MTLARHAPLRVRTRVETSAAPRCLFYDELAVFKTHALNEGQIAGKSVRNTVKHGKSVAFIRHVLHGNAAFGHVV